jgi:hypothetical protein
MIGDFFDAIIAFNIIIIERKSQNSSNHVYELHLTITRMNMKDPFTIQMASLPIFWNGDYLVGRIALYVPFLTTSLITSECSNMV